MSIDLTKVTLPWDPWILGALVTEKERIEEGWDCSRQKNDVRERMGFLFPALPGAWS